MRQLKVSLSYATRACGRDATSNGLLATAERRATQAEGGATQLRKTTYSRDDYGNVWSVADEVASEPVRTTIISYDGDHVFPSTITNADGQAIQVAFDSKWGAPTGVVDGNGVATQIGYDGFGRTTQTIGPDGTTVAVYSLVSQPEGSLSIGSIDPRIQMSTELQGSAGHHGGRSITEYDSYGRAVRTRTVGFGGGDVIQEQTYDALGQLIGRTLSHTADVAFLDVPFEKYSYDYLQRLTRVAHSVGGGYATGSFKEYQYASSASLDLGAHGQWLNGMTCPSDSPLSKCAVEFRLTSDELGHQNAVITDYLGRVVRNVDGENVDNTLHSSNYLYGPWGQLVTALDNNGSRTQLSYDNYGRLRSRKDPDTSPGVVGLAAAQGFSSGAGAAGSIGSSFLSGAGSGALGAGANVAVSLFSGGYGGGSKGGSYDVPTAGAPTGNGVSNLSPAAKASGGPSELARPRLFDPARGALAQSTPAGEGGPGYVIRTDGTGGGVPIGQTSE